LVIVMGVMRKQQLRKTLIDACSSVRRFARILTERSNTKSLLRWVEAWYPAGGHGVVAGLLDTSFDEQIPDLSGAHLVTRDFTDSGKGCVAIAEHGTHSVTLLIGQGHNQIRGLIPHACLLVAKVVGPNGIAAPRAVVEAIDWLVSSGSQILVLPLGEAIEREEIAQQIEFGAECGAVLFAAAGNGYPDPLAFPARHPVAIAVGAADFHGNLLPECSRFPRLDLVAPGWKIAAPVHKKVIRRRSGSSVACVIAAGVAILALSAGAISARSICRAKILASLRKDCVVQSPS
jgi:serine protease